MIYRFLLLGLGMLAVATFLDSYNSHCIIADFYIGRGGMENYNIAADILSRYDCPCTQQRYMSFVTTRDDIQFRNLKNQKLTIEFLLAASISLSQTYRYLIDRDYDKDLIAESLDCTNSDKLNLCTTYVHELPQLKAKLIQILSLDEIIDLRLCGRKEEYMCIQRCFEFPTDECLKFMNYFVFFGDLATILLNVAIERRNIHIAIYAIEHNANYSINEDNANFFRDILDVYDFTASDKKFGQVNKMTILYRRLVGFGTIVNV